MILTKTRLGRHTLKNNYTAQPHGAVVLSCLVFSGLLGVDGNYLIRL